MKIILDKIKDVKPRREHGDISDLKQSIQKCGLINPLTINQNYKLLAGRRRFQAIQELGWEEVDCRMLNSDNELFDFKIALEENLKRKNLTDPEIAIAIKEYDEMKRRLEGERLKGGRGGVRQTLTIGEGWTTDKTAKDLNISSGSVRQAIQIAKAIEENPELAKEKSGLNILVKYKKEKEKDKIKTLKTPKGLYDVIVIDPPYESYYDAKGRRGGAKYPTMNIEEIKAIKLPANKDCILWLWCTNKYLHEAFHILEEWEFEYKNTFTWIKKQLGLGNWGRTQTEHILLGIKGKPIIDLSNQKNIIIADRKGHSEKPDEFFDMVNKVCSGRKIDYFGRKGRKGWEVYGSEI